MRLTVEVSFVELIYSYPTREALCLDCPALAVLLYQDVVSRVQRGQLPRDPFHGTARKDGISEMLAVSSLADLFLLLYSDSTSEPQQPSSTASFWAFMRRSVEASWTAATNPTSMAFLCSLKGRPRFQFPPPQRGGQPLHPLSLERSLAMSKRFIRSVTTCVLDGSTTILDSRQPELSAVLQLARLVPYQSHGASSSSSGTGKGSRQEVTPEGLHFCMISLQQRWFILLNAAVERVLLLTRNDEEQRPALDSNAPCTVTKPLLWQLLAILLALDGSQMAYAFPEKQQDLASHHLLARLAEIGLVYPLQTDGRRCFVVSPDYAYALQWQSNAPLSLTYAQQRMAVTGDATEARETEVRREDGDTIITETNFRLYAYTHDGDLLNVLDQFAELEEVVSNSLRCYRVTRNSFAAAMRKGITAAQILRFLSLRAHPSMLKQQQRSSGGDRAMEVGQTPQQRSQDSDALESLVVPQSFCDQMRMWESECRRVVFEKNLVLLRNISTARQAVVMQYLGEAGEADAVVHSEPGYMVIQEDVYERLLSSAMPNTSSA